MATPLSEWRKRMHELLSDGEWHEMEPVVREAMLFVPPGPAYRHAEKARVRGTGPAKRERGSDSDAIAAGQRQIVMQSVYAAVKYGAFERKVDGGVFYIRDVSIGKRPATDSDADDLARALRDQIAYWDRTKKIIPPGDVRDQILGGDPVKDIKEALRRNGRT